MTLRCRRLVLLALLALSVAAAPEARSQETSCVACHGDPARAGGAVVHIEAADDGEIHASVGLSCHDCHGGNPDPTLSGDRAAAMDPHFAENPYRGAPARPDVPEFCGRCHSDPVFMRRFQASPRVDQEREYWTSQHGKALARGDTAVATCIDCHGVHDILRVGDPRSRAYPKTVAETCRGCHADPARMAGRTTTNGRPMPVDQYARWRRSVHAAALLERDDLSAPTCNDCHGNHGAVPPGLHAISLVCGQCHGKEAVLFRSSPKLEAYANHQTFLDSVAPEGCAACHADPDPAAHLDHPSLGECTACHENHAVVRPTLALLSPLPETPCAVCHEGNLVEAEEDTAARERFRAMRDALLATAASKGLEGDDRFDWLVDQASLVPFHHNGSDAGAAGSEFRRLFEKFRIGKTRYSFEDPVTGETRQVPIHRCQSCHAKEPGMGVPPVGLDTAAEMLHRMQELTSVTAAAERTLLRARRGGVEVRDAQAEVQQSVDHQIQLEVLVHTFSVAPDSEFVQKHKEGMQHAEAALDAGQKALAELAARRRGLIGFLLVIGLALVALVFKIREGSIRR